jgi:hypothetical protein
MDGLFAVSSAAIVLLLSLVCLSQTIVRIAIVKRCKPTLKTFHLQCIGYKYLFVGTSYTQGQAGKYVKLGF